MIVKRSTSMSRRIMMLVNVVVIIGLIAFGGYYFKKYRDLKNTPINAEAVAQQQADQTIEEVGKLYDLPDDEKPNVATVSDKEKLKDQPFFIKAENGDITLIYQNAKLAILYRPSTKQLINVSSVTIQGNVRIKVIGTEQARKSAIAAMAKTDLTSADGGDAKLPPTSITVVDISGQNANQATNIAKIVGGKVGALPSGEDKPSDIDILVVAGP